MKIGFFAIGIGATADPELIRDLTIAAERLNFSTIWAPEHLAFIDGYTSRYPYAPAGSAPVTTSVALLNPFLALTYAAACSSKIRLATGIALVPERHPLDLAKIVATLDHLSRGRFALGIGIGWLAEEFQALGIPWERRAARTREYINVMRKLWSEERSDHHGDFVNFAKVRSFPKPVQGAKLPIIVGGQTPAALRRTAEYGDGWYGFNLSPEESATHIRQLRELLRGSQRDAAAVEMIVAPPVRALTLDDLKRYREAGVDELVLPLSFASGEGAAIVKALETAARELVEPAAKL